ncbi:MAG: L,D-transpeptidase family protein [Aquificae bacterium]|nr:L,D-transpeptidase family protein [Aquificota bacterium]
MKILARILIITLVYGFINISLSGDVLKELQKLEEKKFQLANQSIGMFYDRIYEMSISYGEQYLKIADKDDEHYQKVIDILYLSYYYLEKTEKLFNLIKNDLIKDKDLVLKGLVLLSKKGKEKEVRYLIKKYKLKDAKNKKYKKLKGFELGKNIFKIDSTNVFGKNEIYICEKNQTLLEIAKKTDMGFFELYLANDILNPFDIKKGQVIILPRRRIIPKFYFEFGIIYINLQEKRLYYPLIIKKKQYVITFPVGVGTDNIHDPIGEFEITQKRKNPIWYPTKRLREENPSLPKAVAPGKNNPLGTRAMRLGETAYLIHGTNKPYGIGMKVSHGCIRMYNKDVEKLFNIVEEGTIVKIFKKSIKVGKKDGKDFLEIDTDERIDLQSIKKEIQKYSFKEYSDFYLRVKSSIRGTAVPLEE